MESSRTRLKHIVATYVIEFLEDNSVFYNYQFGFRKSHSTSHVIVTLVVRVSKALDMGKYVVGVITIYIDIHIYIPTHILTYTHIHTYTYIHRHIHIYGKDITLTHDMISIVITYIDFIM